MAPVQPDYGKCRYPAQHVAKAKKLLAEAGYPNGFDTELFDAGRHRAGSWPNRQAATEQWKEIGVRVKLNIMPGAEYWDVWTKVPFGCTIWYHRPLGLMVLGLAYRTGVPWNESGYSNPEFDKLLTEAGGTLDIDKRARGDAASSRKSCTRTGRWRSRCGATIFTFMDKKVAGLHDASDATTSSATRSP